eukprot:5165088-Prymnesium_polylepis.2
MTPLAAAAIPSAIAHSAGTSVPRCAPMYLPLHAQSAVPSPVNAMYVTTRMLNMVPWAASATLGASSSPTSSVNPSNDHHSSHITMALGRATTRNPRRPRPLSTASCGTAPAPSQTASSMKASRGGRRQTRRSRRSERTSAIIKTSCTTPPNERAAAIPR